jgi:transcriptional regulator with PAS, ATPase and Fis domain
MPNSEFTRTFAPTTQVLKDGETGLTLKMKQAQLHVIEGPDKGLKKMIPPHGLVVGKARDCSFMLTDSTVSARHFRVLPSDLGFVVQDLGSRNGTWFHGARVHEICVGRKESFKAGRSALRLELLDRHQEYALSQSSCFGQMLGSSVAMRQAFALLERASQTDATLLIEGESGTGKDLAAETVHLYSARKDGPFIVVDCGGMQSNLVESQLFGHCKGAFTGADVDRIGAFEAAEGGTVFLDEIGELDPSLQPKLLRVLEKKQIQRLGETTYRPVDVRVIAATNRDLDSDVSSGQFRKDLFYRLSVLRVYLPALRDRPDDIPAIAGTIIQQLKPDAELRDVLSDQVLAMILRHDWPGNVRELRNYLERLLIFPEWTATDKGKGQRIQSLGPLRKIDLPYFNARDMFVEHFEKEYVEELLDDCRGVISHAAEKARISRNTLYRLMSKYSIPKSPGQNDEEP